MSGSRNLHVRVGGTLHGVIKGHVLQTLAEVHGNKSEAARRVGVGRNTLVRWLKDWAGPLPGTDEFLNEEHA